MLIKNIIALALLLASSTVLAQSKWNADFGGGTTIIKEDVSASVFLGFGYQTSERIKLNLNTIYSKPEFYITDKKYDFNQISLEAEYSFTPQSDINLASIMGFSYLHFGDDIDLENNDGLGINLGVLLAFNNLKKFNYGFRIVNTYSSISYGGIFSTNVFIRYNF